MALTVKNIVPLKHHIQNEVCVTRPKYRQGRKDTAVKVYTVSQESQYLLIIGVPSVGVKDDLMNLCSTYGEVSDLYPLDDYPSEEFTETYLISYRRIQSARVAKRKLDTYSFFGSALHVCYAPEFESVEETRAKLIGRQWFINMRTNSGHCGPWNTRHVNTKNNDQMLNGSTSKDDPPTTSGIAETYIWAGKTFKMSDFSCQRSATPEDGATNEDSGERSTGNRVATRLTDLLPRQLKRSLDPTGNSFQSNIVEEENFGKSMKIVSNNVRNTLTALSVPNPDIVFKRKKLSQS